MGIHERKERERARRRQQIMVAAKRVFSSKGYSKTTMEDIALVAEVSPATIYLYFKNKDELFASLSLSILRYLLLRVENINKEKGTTAADRLDLLRQAMIDAYEFDPLTLANLFHLQAGETLKNLSPALLEEIQGAFRSMIDAMAIIFKEGVRAGLIVDQAPVALASIAWALFSGMVLLDVSQKDTQGWGKKLKDTFYMAFHIFKQGIVPSNWPLPGVGESC